MKTFGRPKNLIENARFVRLGQQGQLAQQCIDEGVVFLDFHEVPHDLCEDQQWDQLPAIFPEAKKGAIPNIISKLKHFYESDETTLWLTRHENQWWYCFAQAKVEPQPNGTRIRRVVEPWRCFESRLQKRLDCELGSLRHFLGALCTLNETQLAYLQTCLG